MAMTERAADRAVEEHPGRGRPLRVLTVTNLYPSPHHPSYGSFVASQVESLREEGIETDVYFIDGHRSKWEYLKAIWAIRPLLTRGGYDLVHSHYGLSAVYPLLFHRLPVVVSFLGDDVLGGERFPVLKSRVSDFVSRRADAVIVKSDEMKERLGLAAAHVVPNGVDFRRFRPLDRAESRKKLGYALDRRYAIFPYDPARAVKGFDLASDAMRIVAESVPAEIKTVSGVDPAMMPDHYNAADLLLLTSLSEGSPNAVKEALACNLPVVSTPCGDVAERLAGVSSCHLVDRSPRRLADAILSVLASQNPRSNGREKIASLESSVIARRIIEIYRRALG